MVPVDKWIMEKPMFGHPLMTLAPFFIPAVFKLYDALSGFSCPSSYAIGPKRAKEIFPQLEQKIKYAQIFYEGEQESLCILYSRMNTHTQNWGKNMKRTT